MADWGEERRKEKPREVSSKQTRKERENGQTGKKKAKGKQVLSESIRSFTKEVQYDTVCGKKMS